MSKLLAATLLASFLTTNAGAYGVDANSLNTSVVMASAISISQQPTNISFTSLIPGVSMSTTTMFNADGDNAETMICSLSGTGINGDTFDNAILYRDSDSANSGDTIVATLVTECLDGLDSFITLSVESSDTDDSDIGKSFGIDGPVTLNISYLE